MFTLHQHPRRNVIVIILLKIWLSALFSSTSLVLSVSSSFGTLTLRKMLRVRTSIFLAANQCSCWQQYFSYTVRVTFFEVRLCISDLEAAKVVAVAAAVRWRSRKITRRSRTICWFTFLIWPSFSDPVLQYSRRIRKKIIVIIIFKFLIGKLSDTRRFGWRDGIFSSCLSFSDVQATSILCSYACEKILFGILCAS